MHRKHIHIEDYNYQLPDDRIARFPLNKRDWSKLLIYRHGKIKASVFSEIPALLDPDSLLVFNDTKVLNARLKFRKETGAHIEIFCLEPHEPSEYTLNLKKNDLVYWKCLVGNLKKWKTDVLHKHIDIEGHHSILSAEKVAIHHEHVIIKFSWDNTRINFSNILEKTGTTPIPPYLKRESEELDKKRYQTVYSTHEGSVAAPTAGLHFTDELLQKLHDLNIMKMHVTLHVSAGTFRPVQSTNIRNHQMHEECIILDRTIIKKLSNLKRKVISVGTTTARTLESLYWLGVKTIHNPHIKKGDLYIDQWEYEELPQDIEPNKAFHSLYLYMASQDIDQFPIFTRIIIIPGYHFRAINGLITNFHMPKSTLLLLIAAFVGEEWKKIYQYALNHQFRFLSYGDSCLLFNDKPDNTN